MNTTLTATKRTTTTRHTPRHTDRRATDTPPEPAECPVWCRYDAFDDDDLDVHVGPQVERQLPGGGYVTAVYQQPIADPTASSVFIEVSDGTPGARPTFVELGAEVLR